MATTEKIRKDIEKTKEKIAEQQKRLRALEAQLTEEEQGADRLSARLRQRHDLSAGWDAGQWRNGGCGR